MRVTNKKVREFLKRSYNIPFSVQGCPAVVGMTIRWENGPTIEEVKDTLYDWWEQYKIDWREQYKIYLVYSLSLTSYHRTVTDKNLM
jgi:hypothetical protein